MARFRTEEIEAEHSRLTEVFNELNLQELEQSARKLRINAKGSKEELVDRLTRFDLIRIFGDNAAEWNLELDTDPNHKDFRPTYNPEDTMLRNSQIETLRDNELEKTISEMDKQSLDKTAQDKQGTSTPVSKGQGNRNVNEIHTVPVTSSPVTQSNQLLANYFAEHKEITHSAKTDITLVPTCYAFPSATYTTAASTQNTIVNNQNTTLNTQLQGVIPQHTLPQHMMPQYTLQHTTIPQTVHQSSTLTNHTIPSISHTSQPLQQTTFSIPYSATQQRLEPYGTQQYIPQQCPPFWPSPYMYNPYMWPPIENRPNVATQNAPQSEPRPATAFQPMAQSSYANVQPSFLYSSREDSYKKQNQACSLLQKWKIHFKGEPKEDVEEFLIRLKECQECLAMPDEDIVKLVPVMFTGAALYWARPLYKDWRTVEDLAVALRRQYGIPDFQLRLEDEIRARTQGVDECISSFLASLRLLMNKVVPRLSLPSQLDRTYRNLHPEYLKFIKRDQFRSFEELQTLGQQEEIRKEREKAYKPPPPPDQSLFPDMAYRTRVRKHKTAALAVNSEQEDEGQEVAAIVQNTTKMTNNNDRKNRTNKHKNTKFTNTNAKPTQDTTNTSTRPNTSDKKNKWLDHPAYPCWVCRKVGHWAYSCPDRQGILCFKCGEPNVTLRTCHKCNKQGNDKGGKP